MSKIVSVFIAVALSVGLFHELRLTGFPRLEDGNNLAWSMFTAKVMGEDELTPVNWRARALSRDISGFWLILWGTPHQAIKLEANVWMPDSQSKSGDCTASYHATFFFLTCLVLIAFVEKPLLAMGMTALSILFSAPAFLAPYLMPWDLPTMFMWTLIALLYLRKPGTLNQWLFLAVLIVLGGLLKETVLVTALFMLGAPWKRWQRLTSIAIIILASQALNWLFCGAAPDWMFSIKGQQAGLPNWQPWRLWPSTLANVGTIGLMPFILWKHYKLTKDWPLVLTIGSFVTLQALGFLNTGYYDENRDWLEIAPVAWILIGQLALGLNKRSIPQEAINKNPTPGMAQV